MYRYGLLYITNTGGQGIYRGNYFEFVNIYRIMSSKLKHEIHYISVVIKHVKLVFKVINVSF